MIDEFQDTNYAQYKIVKLLAAQHENVCVVGDDAQSIYAFRGATIDNILSFEKDYPDLKIFKLEQNYRSTESIVKLQMILSSLIKVNYQKKYGQILKVVKK
jgi:DNA helicase-2/ATP-dependent DNA helicase PcrA